MWSPVSADVSDSHRVDNVQYFCRGALHDAPLASVVRGVITGGAGSDGCVQ